MMRRSQVEESLAKRGRPLFWANVQEAAALSGVSEDVFRGKVHQWEGRGFPIVNPENGKRSIPAILAFWGLPQNHSGPTAHLRQRDDEDGEENWGGPATS